jgi:RNA polymerase sigma factor (sigma-70 family)
LSGFGFGRKLYPRRTEKKSEKGTKGKPNMTPDWLLLRRFVQDNSQEAFAALTARYLNLVYSVCLREVHDPELASDVTQAVFLLLARTAPKIRSRTALPSWLFRTARFASQNARTREQRRRDYEEKVAQMMQPHAWTDNAGWEEIEPLLNQSLAALRAGERECVLLRFFQGLSFAEVGASLGLSEEAARKRVTRSVDKMRQFFTKEGVIVPAIVLPVLLTTHAVKAAPVTSQATVAHLAHSVLAGHTTAALTGSHAYQISQGAMNAMKIAQIKVVVGVTTVAVIGLGSYAVSHAVKSRAAQSAAELIAVTNPGHIYRQIPGKRVTAAQIAERCERAYAALQTYQCSTKDMTREDGVPWPVTSRSMASIQFERPGKIHVQGQDAYEGPRAYTSNGTATEEVGKSGRWEKDDTIEAAIAGATIPEVLFGNVGAKNPALVGWAPIALNGGIGPEVREDVTDGKLCYVLTGHRTLSLGPLKGSVPEKELLWIDEKTFLIHRRVTDSQFPASANLPYSTPQSGTIDNHFEEQITDEKINEPLPASTFTLPAVQ